MKRKVAITLLAVTLLMAGGFTWIASSHPDGLEWSIQALTGSADVAVTSAPEVHRSFASVQQSTSLLPDYDSTWSGIIGCSVVVVLVWGVSTMVSKMRMHRQKV